MLDMKPRITIAFTCLLILLTGVLAAEPALKVGYVNMNHAINESDEGKRSKKFLEAQLEQTKRTLEMKRQEIEAKEKELQESLMLNESVKAQKRQEIEQMKQNLREEAQKHQNIVRRDEARHTQKIFEDLVSVIEKIAQAEQYDVVLEFNVKQTILYSRYQMNDITDKVIEEYNRIQSIE